MSSRLLSSLRRSSLAAIAFGSVALLALDACSVIVDGAIPDDPLPMDSCTGLADGTTCSRTGITAPLVCRAGACTNSRCGDGLLDTRPKEDGSVEACDDGNSDAGDGCEPDCSETEVCTSDANCPAPEIPCVTGVCDTLTGECSVEPAVDGNLCDDGDGNSGICMDGTCVAANCGNGVIDTGEQCDDGNTDDKDGCSPFCKPECLDNNACRQDACTGYERCEVTMGPSGQIGLCVPDGSRMVLSCDASCEICDAIVGACVPSADADADGDGHPSTACGGDDCDDDDPDVNPGLEEICGDGVDANCNGDADEGMISTWYADCDDDAFASSGAESMSSCGEPATAPAGCSAGGWTTRAPASPALDCLDGDPDVRPYQREYFASSYTFRGAPSFDYDCDGSEEPEYARVLTPLMAGCGTRCDAPPVVNLSATCGETATRYECRLSGGVCQRIANSFRYYLACQ